MSSFTTNGWFHQPNYQINVGNKLENFVISPSKTDSLNGSTAIITMKKTEILYGRNLSLLYCYKLHELELVETIFAICNSPVVNSFRIIFFEFFHRNKLPTQLIFGFILLSTCLSRICWSTFTVYLLNFYTKL
jgi:hypothetical protein